MNVIDSNGHVSREFLAKTDMSSLFTEERNVISVHISYCPYCAEQFAKATQKSPISKPPNSLVETIVDSSHEKYDRADSLTRALSISVGIAVTAFLLFEGPKYYDPLKGAADYALNTAFRAQKSIRQFERSASEYLGSIDIGGFNK